MGKKYSEIKKMSKKEVEDKYDEAAKHSHGGLSFWRRELFYRETEALYQETKKLNKKMLCLTIVIAILTLFNVIMVIILAFR